MKRDSLANKAFSELRKKILSNQLTPNTRLKEAEWAEKMGVSRMAVREALTRLLGEDLVVLGKKGGYFVKPLLASDVHQIRELREVLELGAIRLAFRKMTTEQLDNLERICDDFSLMVKNGYFHGALEADIKFHETLIEYSENEKLLRVYNYSHIPLFHQKVGKIKSGLNDYEQTDQEHRHLVKALRDKNLQLAEKILIEHFARGEAVVLDLD